MNMNIRPLATVLIEELDAEALNFKIVLLVVIFLEASTVFIRSDSPDRLGATIVALARGGKAIGLIGMRDKDESLLLFYGRVLPPYAGDGVFSRYLACIADEIKEILHLDIYESSPDRVN